MASTVDLEAILWQLDQSMYVNLLYDRLPQVVFRPGR